MFTLFVSDYTMNKNIGDINRVTWITIAIIATSLFFADIILGTPKYTLLAIGSILPIMVFCGTHAPIGLNTYKKMGL